MTYNTMKGKYEDFGEKSHFLGNPEVQNFGGYSGSVVVHEDFLVKIPDNIPPDKAGPLLCAGITMFDPLCHWGAVPGPSGNTQFMYDSDKHEKMTIGIVGCGGLGTMGIKLAKALGHDVVAISHSSDKYNLALEKGADRFVVSTSKDSMKFEHGKIDLILNTVAAPQDINAYMNLLTFNGTMVMLGLIKQPYQVNAIPLIFGRKKLAGSTIGGITNTQRMLEFCAQK